MARYCFTGQDPLTPLTVPRTMKRSRHVLLTNTHTVMTHTPTQRNRPSSRVDRLRAAVAFSPGICLESCREIRTFPGFQMNRCGMCFFMVDGVCWFFITESLFCTFVSLWDLAILLSFCLASSFSGKTEYEWWSSCVMITQDTDDHDQPII